MSLVAAARRLSGCLEPHAVIIGGICGAMHGVERFTRDVDLASDLPAEAVVTALAKAGITGQLRHGEAGDAVSWVVEGQVDGVEFQVMSTDDVGVNLANAEIRADLRIASVRDFITSKCRAGGQQDLHDVAALTLIDGALLPFAREQAEIYQVTAKLAAWLADRRLLVRYRR